MIPYGDRQRIETEIDSLFEAAESVQPELQASLARYACVLASSYLEAAFRELIVTYTQKRSDRSVRRFVESTLATFRDPNMEKVLQLVGRFDPEFRRSLEEQSAGQLKDSINSISANRNSIAHGRRSGISLGQVRSYFTDAQHLVRKTKALVDA